MRRWAPHDNVRPQAYPPILLRTALGDRTVPPAEVARYCAKLRHRGAGGGPVLLRCKPAGGHYAFDGDAREAGWAAAFLAAAIGGGG